MLGTFVKLVSLLYEVRTSQVINKKKEATWSKCWHKVQTRDPSHHQNKTAVFYDWW